MEIKENNKADAIDNMANDVQVFTKTSATKRININTDEKENELLNAAIKKLPSNYNFEIYKSIVRIKELANTLKKKLRVALQMPDGFMIFSVIIVDLLQSFAECECIILGDITYGACCIDDLGSKSLDCDFIIHYGHSCLVPVTETCVKVMYVFVDIEVDLEHLTQTIEYNFPDKTEGMIIMGSIQYNNSVFLAKKELAEKGYMNILIPQTKPRSSGEVLGCTSPNIDMVNSSIDKMIFICDGRFHMESAMIANPHLTFYQYNPFTKTLTLEKYDVELMKSIRLSKINTCKKAKAVGIIFGILGRQGNPDILNNISKILNKNNVKFFVILLSEISDNKLLQYEECEAFIQIACPRISIDWGQYFSKPVITPYEAFVVWGDVEWRSRYPMDYYSYEGGEWTNYYHKKPKSYKK